MCTCSSAEGSVTCQDHLCWLVYLISCCTDVVIGSCSAALILSLPLQQVVICTCIHVRMLCMCMCICSAYAHQAFIPSLVAAKRMHAMYINCSLPYIQQAACVQGRHTSTYLVPHTLGMRKINRHRLARLACVLGERTARRMTLVMCP